MSTVKDVYKRQGLDRPDSGKVYIEGRDIFALKDEQLAVFRRRKIGFIFQDYRCV